MIHSLQVGGVFVIDPAVYAPLPATLFDEHKSVHLNAPMVFATQDVTLVVENVSSAWVVFKAELRGRGVSSPRHKVLLPVSDVHRILECIERVCAKDNPNHPQPLTKNRREGFWRLSSPTLAREWRLTCGSFGFPQHDFFSVVGSEVLVDKHALDRLLALRDLEHMRNDVARIDAPDYLRTEPETF